MTREPQEVAARGEAAPTAAHHAQRHSPGGHGGRRLPVSRSFRALHDFGWPTTAEEAETVLEDFLANILPGFGDWQDAMAEDQPWMWHG